MNKFNRRPIASQVLIAVGLICVFLVANGGLLFFNLRTIERRNDELQSRILPEQKIGGDLARNLGLLQAEVLHYVLITDAEGMKSHDQIIRQIREENAGKLAEYEKLIHQERDRRIYARASQAGDLYFERTDSLLALSRAQENIEKIRLAVSAQAPAYDEYQKAIKRMIDLSEQEARALAATSPRLISKAGITDTLLLGLAIAIIIGAGFAIIGIVRRIREDNRALQKAGEALRESEERFRSYFELGLIGTAITSPTKGFVEVNDEICRILGYERSELLHMTWGDLTHPDDLTNDVAHFSRVLAGEIDSYAMDKRFIRKDSRVIDATISVRCLRRADGSVDCFVGLLQDITERKIAEGALREGEERLRAVLESALDCIVTIDHHGRVVEFNPAAEKAFGYKRDAAIGQLMADLIIPPTLRERHQRGLEHYLSTGEASVLGQRIELTGMRSDHSEFPVELAITRIGSHEPPMFTGFMRDITERKQAEEALAEQAIRYKTLMETSADSIYVVDTDGDLQEANTEFLRRRGYGAAEVKGLNVADWDAQWTREELKERIRQLVGGNAVFETRHRCKDGSVFAVEVGVTSVRIAGKELFFCVTRDITERKRAEEAAQKSNRELQILSRRRVEVQEDERRHLSRELHDQIGQALMAAQINLQSARRLRKRNNIVGKLADTIAILDQILQQIRQISLDLRPPVLDDLGLAPALQWTLRNHAERAGLFAEFIADPELERLDPEVETACFRVALEALTNVIRHARAQKVSVELCRDNGTLHLIVRDDGIGFDVNRTAEWAHRDRLGLVGMGERATILGGRFRCESAPGDGTEVHAHFPMRREERPESESQ